MYSFLDILHFPLILLPLVFALQLLTYKSAKGLPTKILGALMIVVSIYYWLNAAFICQTLGICKINQNFIYLLFLSITPFYYLYTKSLTTENFYWDKKLLIHYVPAFIIFIFTVLSLNLFKSDSNILSYANVRYAAIIIYNIQVVGYSLGMLLVLIKHKNNIKHNFSYDNEKISLNWIKVFLLIFISFSILDLSVFYFNPHFDLKPFYYILSNVFFIFIGYFGLKQVEIYSITKHLSKSLVEDVPIKELEKEDLKYKELEEVEEVEKEEEKKHSVSDVKSKEIYAKLIELIEKEQVFKQQELSIFDIADMIQINKTYLSYAINKETGSNFSSFINKRRIDYSKKLLEDEAYDNLTIEAIASNVGFQSKSSFNTWFKKLTGKTPSEYKKMQRVEMVG